MMECLSIKHSIDKKINTLQVELEKNRNTRIELNKNIEILEEEQKSLREIIHELKIQKHLYEQQLQQINKDKRRVEQSEKDLKAQKKAIITQLDNLSVSLHKRKEEYGSNKKKLEGFDKEEKSVEQNITRLQKSITTQHSKTDVYQKKLDTSIEKIAVIQQKIQGFKDKTTDVEARITVVSENFRDRYGEIINTYLTNKAYVKKAQEPAEAVKQKLHTIKQEISALGNVNLLAAEEFEQVDDRYKKLLAQLEDLNIADKHLQEIVEKIETESREKMQKAFVEVRKHFKSIFTRIMGGGEADLLLVDSEDILSAGLEIVAQPPQKNTQYLSQLSGGERTLIALSLLFALHSVKPAPFCLLDELDAPLDDSNIDRFLELLYVFKAKTQFVVISHNKRTIAQAQNMIGVTMEERGISKFIGVSLEHEA